MPYKDPEKQKEAVKKAHANTYLTRIIVNVRRDEEEFYNTLKDVAVSSGQSVPSFIKQAVQEKLARDASAIPISASIANQPTRATGKLYTKRLRRAKSVLPKKVKP